MKRFPKVREGEWVRPTMTGYRMACCDCGVVHRLNFKVIKWGRGHKVKFQVFRERRAIKPCNECPKCHEKWKWANSLPRGCKRPPADCQARWHSIGLANGR